MPKTVLIVEDNRMNMKLFDDLLTVYGYQTLKAENGNDGVNLAREHRPDLILMDMNLPGVNGLQVTRWLKDDAALRSIPVVALTALAMKGDAARILSGGCDGYISKPIQVSTFIETVRSYFLDERTS